MRSEFFPRLIGRTAPHECTLGRDPQSLPGRAFKRRWARSWIVIGIAGLCVILGSVVEHAYVAAGSAGTILLIGWISPWVMTRPLSAKIKTRLIRCHAGDPVSLTVEQNNRWFLPIPAVMFDHPSANDLSIQPLTKTVAPGTSWVQLSLFPVRRGIWDLAGFRMITTFPFGTREAGRNVESHGRLIVWPKPLSVPQVLLSQATRSAIVGESRTSLHSQAEPCGVRDYQKGDSLRSIHWQQTARYEKLMVRGCMIGVQQSRTVWMDIRSSSFVDSSLFEQALSVGAWIIEESLREGLITDFWVGNTFIRVQDERGRIESLDRLAGVNLSNEQWPVSRMYQSGGLVVTTHRGWKSLASTGLTPFLVDVDLSGVDRF
ncbi:MAG: hypothetical protein KatS3mg104_0362 [Phycisphaerae bacterium]|nr:MAG: hypothetical protein KatS3mg104_0362 [Phycisphaerae bacterium]